MTNAWEQAVDGADLDGGRPDRLAFEGTHYVALKEYDFKDGTNYSGLIGPVFTFEVVESSSLAKGRVAGQMLSINPKGSSPAATKTRRDINLREIAEIFSALIASKTGQVESIDAVKLKQIAPNVDLVQSNFGGVVIRVDGQRAKNPQYIDNRYAADDREAV